MLAVLKPEAFDWGSDKLPDAHALKYVISWVFKLWGDNYKKKKFRGVGANWQVD
jgi:hypothetical protein